MPTRSSSRRLARLSVLELARTWTAIAKPSSAVRTATSAVAETRSGSRRRTGRADRSSAGADSASAGSMSGTEHPPSDRRGVAEDPDPEDDDHGRRQLASDAELVAEVDDQRGDQDV